nr:carboxyl transferase domain-containing protein [Nonomuraea typhae]
MPRAAFSVRGRADGSGAGSAAGPGRSCTSTSARLLTYAALSPGPGFDLPGVQCSPLGRGTLAGEGAIEGMPAIAFATDPRVRGGAIGAAGCEVIVAACEHAMRQHLAVIGLWHSGGARLVASGAGTSEVTAGCRRLLSGCASARRRAPTCTGGGRWPSRSSR